MTDRQDALKARAEQLFHLPADEAKPDALTDERARRDAEREKMARLRAQRLELNQTRDMEIRRALTGR
jgi:hypothetical protein